MDWVQTHLAVNHISVIGMPFLLLLLALGWARKSEIILRTALWWIVIFAVISVGLKFTGDFAAEQAGATLDPARTFVNQHEQAADQATTGLFLVGVAAAVSLLMARGGRKPPTWSLAVVFLVALATCLLLARTAHMGGQIGHPELR